MEIIKRKEQGERTCQIANATGIPKSTISSILKNGESIKKLSSMPSMMGPSTTHGDRGAGKCTRWKGSSTIGSRIKTVPMAS
ncbi:Hypothetical protein FKW44_016691 [Caligus rogercresseyi]|uniref:HTH psq-type domain-containing protein n=1 Tax=Caligus rogercresseyi TaxID=217165 RepID=A0A7T8H241_CALRO|nr:Hypothetical protein FKW44_016691 [Caligus rogercresseyi]